MLLTDSRERASVDPLGIYARLSASIWLVLMSATGRRTSHAWRTIASGQQLRDDQRFPLADLLDVLRDAYDALPAEVQSAYRQAITALT